MKFVSAEAEESPTPKEDKHDGGSDHDAGQNPNQDDPDKGEDTGADQRDPDHPPSLLEVAERPLPKLLEAEEAAKSVYRGVVVFLSHVPPLNGYH